MGTGLVTIRPKQLEGKQGEELPEQSATRRASRKERGRLFEASGAFCVWACMGVSIRSAHQTRVNRGLASSRVSPVDSAWPWVACVYVGPGCMDTQGEEKKREKNKYDDDTMMFNVTQEEECRVSFRMS